MNPSPISSRAKKVVNLFECLQAAFQEPQYQLDRHAGIGTVDGLGRFKIWARNLGAFQSADFKSSLDYRLRETPKLVTQIVNILDELAESLNDGVYLTLFLTILLKIYHVT